MKYINHIYSQNLEHFLGWTPPGASICRGSFQVTASVRVSYLVQLLTLHAWYLTYTRELTASNQNWANADTKTPKPPVHYSPPRLRDVPTLDNLENAAFPSDTSTCAGYFDVTRSRCGRKRLFWSEKPELERHRSGDENLIYIYKKPLMCCQERFCIHQINRRKMVVSTSVSGGIIELDNGRSVWHSGCCAASQPKHSGMPSSHTSH